MSGPDSRAVSPCCLTYTLPSAGGALWLGLDVTALGALGVTLLATVLLMLQGAPLWTSLLVAAAGSAAAAWPIRGRTILQWLPLVLGQTTRGLLRHRTWTGNLGGHDSNAADDGGTQPDLRVPRAWGRLRLATCADPSVALLLNRARSSVTAVLEVTGTGRFGLLDQHAQDSELGRWGTTLATLLALPELRHLQWLTHTRPQPLPPLSSPSEPGPTGVLPTERAADLAGDYAQLLSRAHAEALTHTHLLALSFKTQNAEQVRAAVRDAAAALLAADLLCCPVGEVRLPQLLRLLLDPALPDDPGAPVTSYGEAVVLSLRSGWASCQTDDSHHRTYALTAWPRVALPADWLSPLLHHPPAAQTARTLVVHARPVALQQAARRARASATKARLDDADRRRLGFVPAAGGALDELDAENTENELLAGYRMADISALLTVHATDPASLEVSARSLQTLSLSQRIDLRPLHGQHSQALAAALPIGHLPGART